jgi:hypothetical protein
MSEVDRYQDETRTWEAEHEDDDGVLVVNVAELMEAPDVIPWVALHEVCDRTAGEAYAIGVEELRTPWDLILKTADLMGKSWLEATDWSEVLRAKHKGRVV